MKMRHGFVSNSSSTSFTFIFNGSTTEDLCKVLKEYAGHFKLRFEMFEGDVYRCTVDDVIEALKNTVIDNPSDEQRESWHTVYPISIEEAIQNVDNEIEDSQKEILRLHDEEVDGKDNAWLIKIYRDGQYEDINKQILLKEAKSRGLDRVIIIEFGDNHGHIQGGEIGYAMDYEGRYIRINQDDLVVVTDQCR